LSRTSERDKVVGIEIVRAGADQPGTTKPETSATTTEIRKQIRLPMSLQMVRVIVR
jgi:hypothetical protein